MSTDCWVSLEGKTNTICASKVKCLLLDSQLNQALRNKHLKRSHKTLTLAQEGEHLFNSTEQIPSTVGAPATGTQKENNIQPNCLGEATVSGTSDL